MIAEVIISSNVKNLNRIFDYQVPSSMESLIQIGSRVFVPFGNSKALEEAFVIHLKEKSDFKVKEIVKIQEDCISKDKIELARFMAKRYFCNIADCLKLMLPPGTLSKKVENRVKEKTANCVYLKVDVDQIEKWIEEKKIKADRQIRILRFLMENEGITTNDLEVFTDTSISTIKTLEKNGLIEIVPKPVERNPFLHKMIQQTEKLVFTKEQQNAFNAIYEKKDEYGKHLIFGITGSRKNRNLFTINREGFKRRKICHYVSSRDFSYPSDGRSFFS